jgi:hypothetical protein
MDNPRQPRPQKPSRSRSRSRPRRPDNAPLHRILSSHFPDDHSVYHHEEGEGGIHVDADARSLHKTETHRRDAEISSSEEDDSSNDVDEKDEVSEEKDSAAQGEERTYEEIRGGIPYEHDVEAPKLEKNKSTRSVKDPTLVTWDSDDDSHNPKNCKQEIYKPNESQVFSSTDQTSGSMKRKWAATFIVSAFTLVSPISSSMISPALTSISAEFNITNEVEAQLTLSIFVLAYAIGPLFLGPLSEIYGRVIVLQLSNLFYLAWNLGCGFAQTSGQLMAFRFFSGLGGSAPLAIGGVRISFIFYHLSCLTKT